MFIVKLVVLEDVIAEVTSTSSVYWCDCIKIFKIVSPANKVKVQVIVNVSLKHLVRGRVVTHPPSLLDIVIAQFVFGVVTSSFCSTH